MPASGRPGERGGATPAARPPGRALVLGLTALLGALAVVSLTVGPAPIGPAAALKALFAEHGSASLIVREIRLPRTLLALGIGGTLGLTGAALQGLLRNPLADPAVFGAPQAAAFGAVLALYFGLAGALSAALPVAAIAGALLSIALVVGVAGRDGSTVTWCSPASPSAASRAPRPRSRSACRRTPSRSRRSCSGSSARWRTAPCATSSWPFPSSPSPS